MDNFKQSKHTFYTLAHNHGNQYYLPLSGQIPEYQAAGNFTGDEVKHCINFAFKLVNEKYDSQERSRKFINYLQGALAEQEVHKQLNEFNQFNSNFPNLSILSKGDKGYDVIVNDKYRIQVKSLLANFQLLLLEEYYYQQNKDNFDFLVEQRINLHRSKSELLKYVEQQFKDYGNYLTNPNHPLVNGFFANKLANVDYELARFMTKQELIDNAKKLTLNSGIEIKREIPKGNSSKIETIMKLPEKNIVIEIKNMHPLSKLLDEIELR